MKRGRFLVSLAAVFILLVELVGGAATKKDVNRRPGRAGPAISGPLRKLRLSEPYVVGAVSLEEALAARRSVRDFTRQTLSLEQIGQLAWAGQGIIEKSKGLRTAPSAGAIYPIRLYFAIKGSVYVYHSAEHSLEKISSQDIREALSSAVWKGPGSPQTKAEAFWVANQKAVAEAACDIIIAGSVKKVAPKYGRNARKFLMLEAGHIAQNIHLQAVSLGLGSAPTAEFNESKVAKICKLPAEEEAIYIIAVGYPTAGPAIHRMPRGIKRPGREPARPGRGTRNETEGVWQPSRPLDIAAARPGGKRAVFIILGNRFQYEELYNTQDVLAAAGVEVTTAGAGLEFIPTFGGSWGEVEIVALLEEVFVEDYDAIIFLTSPASRKHFNYPAVLGIVREGLNRGKIVGAIGGGVRVLADAGVLGGVRVTGNVGDRRSLRRAGAIYTGAFVEQDGLIITARGPSAASLFGRIIAQIISPPRRGRTEDR